MPTVPPSPPPRAPGPPMPTIDDTLRVLRDVFGYPGFRPGQEDVVSAVLCGEGRRSSGDADGRRQSRCRYQLPALVRRRPHRRRLAADRADARPGLGAAHQRASRAGALNFLRNTLEGGGTGGARGPARGHARSCSTSRRSGSASRPWSRGWRAGGVSLLAIDEGALRLAMGPRLPPRLCAARGRAPPARRRADDGAHRHQRRRRDPRRTSPTAPVPDRCRRSSSTASTGRTCAWP